VWYPRLGLVGLTKFANARKQTPPHSAETGAKPQNLLISSNYGSNGRANEAAINPVNFCEIVGFAGSSLGRNRSAIAQVRTRRQSLRDKLDQSRKILPAHFVL
jgi:hypothetical protein